MKAYKATYDGSLHIQTDDKPIRALVEGINGSAAKPAIRGDVNFIVVVHNVADLISNSHSMFAQDYFIRRDTGHNSMMASGRFKDTDIAAETLSHRLPMVHLLPFDIISATDDDEMLRFIRYSIPRYYSIIDSSIWNYFVPVETDTDFNRLAYTIGEIAQNFEWGRYSLAVTNEYADFRARLVAQSFLERLSGHDAYLSPFIYHSEWECRQTLDREESEGIKIEELKKHKWRFLLLDDHIDESTPGGCMTVVDSSELKCSKYNVIHQLLTDRGFKVARRLPDQPLPDDAEKCDIVIHCVSTVDEALEQMRRYEFEIILLDYLLKKKPCGIADEREYGYELIKRITDDINNGHSSKVKIGPTNCLFVMFISAYTTAVSERLLAEGLNHNSRHCEINDSACPTNTPYLFLRNLFRFMRKRLDDTNITKLDISYICPKLLGEIYRMDDNVRHNANEYFDEVLSEMYHYNKLLDDFSRCDYNNLSTVNWYDTSGSALVSEELNKKPYLGGLLEHLMQLVYLTAFGTIRQWPEMWEEFMYIDRMLRTMADSKDVWQQQRSNIETYIRRLKEQDL